MKYLMQMVAPALPGAAQFDRPKFLRSIDWEARRGKADIELTEDQNEAMEFDTPKDVFGFWRKQSEVQPLRSDELPNRPLTAYSIAIHRKGTPPLGY